MDTFAADLSRLPNPTTHRTPPPLRGATAPSLRRQPGPNPGPTSDGPHDLPSPAGCGAPVSTHKTDCEPSISRIEDVHCPLSMFFRPCLFFSGHIRRRLIAVLDRNPTAPSRTTTQTPGTSTELRQIYGPHPRLQPCSRVANGRPATVANRPPARRGAARGEREIPHRRSPTIKSPAKSPPPLVIGEEGRRRKTTQSCVDGDIFFGINHPPFLFFFLLCFSDPSLALLLCCVSPIRSRKGRTQDPGRPPASTRLTMCSDTRHNRVDMYSQLIPKRLIKVPSSACDRSRFSVPAVQQTQMVQPTPMAVSLTSPRVRSNLNVKSTANQRATGKKIYFLRHRLFVFDWRAIANSRILNAHTQRATSSVGFNIIAEYTKQNTKIPPLVT